MPSRPPAPRNSADWRKRLPATGLADDEVELGFVSGVFGVTGEVRLFLHNTDSDVFDELRSVVLIDRSNARWEARLVARSGAGKRVIGRFQGLENREEAAALKDWRLALPKSELPAPDDDEFYVYELVGLDVLIKGARIGRVSGVHPTEGGDVIEVETADGPAFVPAHERFVAEVDLEGGRIVLQDDALDEPT